MKRGTKSLRAEAGNDRQWYLHPSDITERDIDLLILEELNASPSFQRHFIKLLKKALPLDAQFVSGQHSIANSLGQSDLEVTFKDKEARVWRLLCENKIDAAFQPEQADRYRKRGELYVKHGQCDRFLTILVAPSKYVGVAETGFDCAVTYERIRDWFESERTLGLRQACKLGMLDAAIRKGEDVKAKNKRITVFWHRYYELVQELAPELSMRSPVPRSGGFIYFYPPATGGIDFVHKTSYGHVDLQFKRMGSNLEELRAVFEPHLLPHMKIEKAHKAAVIRAVVDKLVIEAAVDEQENSTRECILGAKGLLQWWLEHRKKWLDAKWGKRSS